MNKHYDVPHCSGRPHNLEGVCVLPAFCCVRMEWRVCFRYLLPTSSSFNFFCAMINVVRLISVDSTYQPRYQTLSHMWSNEPKSTGPRVDRKSRSLTQFIYLNKTTHRTDRTHIAKWCRVSRVSRVIRHRPSDKLEYASFQHLLMNMSSIHTLALHLTQ